MFQTVTKIAVAVYISLDGMNKSAIGKEAVTAGTLQSFLLPSTFYPQEPQTQPSFHTSAVSHIFTLFPYQQETSRRSDQLNTVYNYIRVEHYASGISTSAKDDPLYIASTPIGLRTCRPSPTAVKPHHQRLIRRPTCQKLSPTRAQKPGLSILFGRTLSPIYCALRTPHIHCSLNTRNLRSASLRPLGTARGLGR